MPHADLFIAGKYCQSMRDLIVVHTGGWQDDHSLQRFQEMAAAAAASVDDGECKDLAAEIMRLATDLFSATDHEQWVQGKTSGADVLRLRILREVRAFQDRLAAIETMRSAEQQRGASEGRPPKRT